MTTQWLALMLALGVPGRVRGDAGARSPSHEGLARFAKSAAARHEDDVHARARDLERLARALPGVVDAAVALTLADITRTPIDRPLPPPRVTLVLGVRGVGPDDATVLRVARGVVRDLSPNDLTVSRHSVASVAKPTNAAGAQVDVDATSNTLPRAILAASLTSNVLLSLMLLWRARRNRPRRPFVDRGGRGGPHA